MRKESIVIFRDILLFAGLAVLLAGCPAAEKGSLEGSVDPPGPGVSISITDSKRTETMTDAADSGTGRFHLDVAPGTYDVSVHSPGFPFPLVLSAVEVRSGRTTDIGTVRLGPPPVGSASISGRLKAASPGAVLTLLSEGVERASVHTDAKGAFLIERLLPGPYELQIRTPGYADDAVTLNLRDGQQLKQDIRQLYITTIEGIDWQAGIARARGVGLPPGQAPIPTVRREMAKRAALADAERNMLRSIELLQVGPERKLSELLGEKVFAQRIRGLLSGYRIVADRDLSGGRVEIEIEMPLTGPQGITAQLHDR
jgi:hypothetical protein